MGYAARLFNGNAEQTLYRRVTPTEVQREFLRKQWNDLADHLKEKLAGWGYPVSTWLQGSYKYGTLIRPVHAGEEYDVDVGIYFSWSAQDTNVSPTAEQLRDWVQSDLLAYKKLNDDVKEITEPPKERCSRAVYEQQFHIDTPTYHLDPITDIRRLACLSGNWEPSDPKALYKWFKDVVGPESREQLRRLIRYLKGWAAVAFVDTAEARPSSILLTVLASEAFLGLWGNVSAANADDTALASIIEVIYGRLTDNRKVLNPVDKNEDLNRIPEASWNAFVTRMTVLYEASQAAVEAEDEASAALAWEGALSFLMPLPDNADEVEVEGEVGRALMQVPDIRIEVCEKFDGIALATYTNEVPSVPKGRWLKFSIANMQIVPGFADIAWTVRNDGEEADYIGDLGHFNHGIGMVTNWERTAYLGRHYMDCVIRCNGSIYAVRRVPVNIRSEQRLLAQGQRNWTKLRTRRGRRK